MISTLELMDCFGLDDPFEIEFQSSDSVRIARLIGKAVAMKKTVKVLGERGIGKTMTSRNAMLAMKEKAHIVWVVNSDNTVANDIMNAIILDLSNEKPLIGRELKKRQIRRIIGAAIEKKPVAIVIEEAHQLHPQTLKAIKRLQELDWMGQTKLFAVILIGQSDPMNQAGLSEVQLRSDTLTMIGLTKAEAIQYMRQTVGSVFSDEAIQAIVQAPDSGNYLDLQRMIVDAMTAAFSRNSEKVDIQDVERKTKIEPTQKSNANANAKLRSLINEKKTA